MKHISRTVWIVSFVSLFTDIASEMLYPIMPMYLKSIGFSIVLIGILEGIAEATAGLSKGYFGKLSDSTGRRVPFVQIGYALSAISKPMMGLFIYPIWIFAARTLDRIGKGVRTGARDAILSDESTPETKGRIFGFHRSMDTLGAALGPVFALVYLYFYPQEYQTLLFIAFVPGVLAVAASRFLHDTKQLPAKEREQERMPSFFSSFDYWKTSPVMYRKVVVGLLVFTLFNSSDVFLLLRLKQVGLSDTITIGVYIFYNLVYALFAFPIGIVADRIGLKKVFITGLALFAVVYFGMATAANVPTSILTSIPTYLGLFFLYGLYAAATEGISKAWIVNLIDKKDTATAIGTYTGFQSICTIGASSFAGLMWYQFGAASTFFLTSGVTVVVIAYFLFATPIPIAKKLS